MIIYKTARIMIKTDKYPTSIGITACMVVLIVEFQHIAIISIT